MLCVHLISICKARVQVTDGGSPPLSDTATVSITVNRNKESPRFLHALDLTRNIPETLPAGSEVIDLNATDDDFFVSYSENLYVVFKNYCWAPLIFSGAEVLVIHFSSCTWLWWYFLIYRVFSDKDLLYCFAGSKQCSELCDNRRWWKSTGVFLYSSQHWCHCVAEICQINLH